MTEDEMNVAFNTDSLGAVSAMEAAEEGVEETTEQPVEEAGAETQEQATEEKPANEAEPTQDIPMQHNNYPHF